MLQKSNRHKVLQVFFDDPHPGGNMGYPLREICRRSKLPPPSVKRYLDEFTKEGHYGYHLILKEKPNFTKAYPRYLANSASEYYKFLKKQNIIQRIYESGLLLYLQQTCLPRAIILYGSASRGEDIAESDIDLFILSKDRKLSVKKYEKDLNRKIHLFFKEEFHKLSNELKNNILNGALLYGYIKVF